MFKLFTIVLLFVCGLFAASALADQYQPPISGMPGRTSGAGTR